jgi:hypothetical protein
MTQIRQGDVLLMPLPGLPGGAELKTDRSGIRIVGERAEHSHTLQGDVAVLGDRLFVRGGQPLMHEEHGILETVPVWYEVRQQREHVPAAAPVRRWD